MAARAAIATLKPSPDATAFDVGKEVMEKLRTMHMVLGGTMESMLQVSWCDGRGTLGTLEMGLGVWLGQGMFECMQHGK